MKKAMMFFALAVLPLAGCGTVAERRANAIEPRIEKIVDSQIEREERAQGIWGTPESYFYAQKTAEETAIREEAQEMVAVWADEVMHKIDELIDARLKKGGK